MRNAAIAAEEAESAAAAAAASGSDEQMPAGSVRSAARDMQVVDNVSAPQDVDNNGNASLQSLMDDEDLSVGSEAASNAAAAESDAEFDGHDCEDDEATLAAEEAAAAAEGRSAGGAAEVSELEADAEVPMEELLAQWQAAVAAEAVAAAAGSSEGGGGTTGTTAQTVALDESTPVAPSAGPLVPPAAPPTPPTAAGVPAGSSGPSTAPAKGAKGVSKSRKISVKTSKAPTQAKVNGAQDVGVLRAAKSRTSAGRAKAAAAAASAFHAGMVAHFKTMCAGDLLEKRRDLVSRVKGRMRLDDGSAAACLSLAAAPLPTSGYGHPGLQAMLQEEHDAEHNGVVPVMDDDTPIVPWCAVFSEAPLPQEARAREGGYCPPPFPKPSVKEAALDGKKPPPKPKAPKVANKIKGNKKTADAGSVLEEAPPEPPLGSTPHWSALLAEAAWMAQDFADERKRKQKLRRTVVGMVQRVADKRAAEVLVTARRAEGDRRAAASRQAKEVAAFWRKIDKLVIWKHRSRLEAMRRDALDAHLEYLVGQSEQYSSGLAKQVSAKHDPSAADPPRLQPGGGSKRSLEPTSAPSSTSAPATQASSHTAPLAAATATSTSPASPASRQPSSRKRVRRAAAGAAHAAVHSKGSEGEGGSDAEFDGHDCEDDEATLAAEEAAAAAEGRSAGGAAEVSELEADAEVPMEELLAQWQAAVAAEAEGGEGGGGGGDATSQAGAHGSDASDSESEGSADGEDDAMLRGEDGARTHALVCGAHSPPDSYATRTPFLLHGGGLMRSYQREGLDWLVSMHDRRLNGILADEMGLGKTLQTISLLAHLASERCIWGPHLVIAPTSTLLNWEEELRRWCPALKVLTYYGSIKDRKAKRTGWSKPDAFHVCVTSYQLAVTDAAVFKRKKWYYVVLDEGHYIRNFKSKRWQTLLTLSSARRLLLTGTPLQNNLLELWSLMHFLMPHLFRSQAEFKEWFANPLTDHVEGGQKMDPKLVARLHTVLRPFVLRRLKTDVAKQLPGKFEHVISCSLAKRQRLLYEDYMSRGSTRAALEGRAGGGSLSMMNVLMQLRKVCNHPDLFEPRPVQSPLQSGQRTVAVPHCVLLAPIPIGWDFPLGNSVTSVRDIAPWWRHPAALALATAPGAAQPSAALVGVGGTIPVGGTLAAPDIFPAVLHGLVFRPGVGLYQAGTGCSIDPWWKQSVPGGEVWHPHGGAGGASTLQAGLVPLTDSSIFVSGEGGVRSISGAPAGRLNDFSSRALTVTMGPNDAQVAGAPGLSDMGPLVLGRGGLQGMFPVPLVTQLGGVSAGRLGGSPRALHIAQAPLPPLGTAALACGDFLPAATPLPISLLRRGVDLASTGLLFTPLELQWGGGKATAARITELSSVPVDVLIPPEPILEPDVAAKLPPVLANQVEGCLKRAWATSMSAAGGVGGGKKRTRNATNGEDGTSAGLTWGGLLNAQGGGLLPHLTLLHAAAAARRHQGRLDTHRRNLGISAQRIATAQQVVYGHTLHRLVSMGPSPIEWAHTAHHSAMAARHLQSDSSPLAWCQRRQLWEYTACLAGAATPLRLRYQQLLPLITAVACVVPAASARRAQLCVGPGAAMGLHKGVYNPPMHPLVTKLPSATAQEAVSTALASAKQKGVQGGSSAWALTHAPAGSVAAAVAAQVAAQLQQQWHVAASQLSLQFPGQHLLQHDCGKLQALAGLLRTKQAAGSKVLIFTQMTRMLDVLEGWLNAGGYTYLRLDGGTPVDTRQAHMNRFNSDPKVFAFILTTRAGGLGINLVGADTVVFYDTDWNPAMDAQAQDRAHRIGQTREVHIYRLVTTGTVEENILLKSAQKREMNRISLEQGNFNLQQLKESGAGADGGQASNVEHQAASGAGALFDGGGVDLRELVTGAPSSSKAGAPSSDDDWVKLTEAVEDEGDVTAGAALKKELSEQAAEFSEEHIEAAADSTAAAGGDAGAPAAPNAAAPIAKADPADDLLGGVRGLTDVAGADEVSAEEGAMLPPSASRTLPGRVQAVMARYKSVLSRVQDVERYGLVFREHTEPHPWVDPVLLQQLQDDFELGEEEWHWEQEQAAKKEKDSLQTSNAEMTAMAAPAGVVTDTMLGGGTAMRPAAAAASKRLALQSHKHLFFAELATVRSGRLMRAVTGNAWAVHRDTNTARVFYANSDDGSDSWVRPPVLLRHDEAYAAVLNGWAHLPRSSRIAVTLMSFVGPGVCRGAAAQVCRVWAAAARHPLLHWYVNPSAGTQGVQRGDRVVPTLSAALSLAQPCERIVLAYGAHYSGGDLRVDLPCSIEAEGAGGLANMNKTGMSCPSLALLQARGTGTAPGTVGGGGQGLAHTYSHTLQPGAVLRGVLSDAKGAKGGSAMPWCVCPDWALGERGEWLAPGHADPAAAGEEGGPKHRSGKQMSMWEAHWHTREGRAAAGVGFAPGGYKRVTGALASESSVVTLGGSASGAPLRDSLLRVRGTVRWSACTGALRGLAIRNVAPAAVVTAAGTGHVLAVAPGAGCTVSQCDLRQPSLGAAVLAIGFQDTDLPVLPEFATPPCTVCVLSSSFTGGGDAVHEAHWSAQGVLDTGQGGGSAVAVWCGTAPHDPPLHPGDGPIGHRLILHDCAISQFAASGVHVIEGPPLVMQDGEGTPPSHSQDPLRVGGQVLLSRCRVLSCLGSVLRVTTHSDAHSAQQPVQGSYSLCNVRAEGVMGGLVDCAPDAGSSRGSQLLLALLAQVALGTATGRTQSTPFALRGSVDGVSVLGGLQVPIEAPLVPPKARFLHDAAAVMAARQGSSRNRPATVKLRLGGGGNAPHTQLLGASLKSLSTVHGRSLSVLMSPQCRLQAGAGGYREPPAPAPSTQGGHAAAEADSSPNTDASVKE